MLTPAYPDSEVSTVTVGTAYADGFFGCANGCSDKGVDNKARQLKYP
jgi:hypothetical protein